MFLLCVFRPSICNILSPHLYVAMHCNKRQRTMYLINHIVESFLAIMALKESFIFNSVPFLEPLYWIFINFQFFIDFGLSLNRWKMKILVQFTFMAPSFAQLLTLPFTPIFPFQLNPLQRVCLTRFRHSLHWTFRLLFRVWVKKIKRLLKKGFHLRFLLNCFAQQRVEVNMNKINIGCLFL